MYRSRRSRVVPESPICLDVRSGHSISIDRDMSIDSIYVFANGAAVLTDQQQDHLIDEERDAESYQILRGILTDFALDLAKLVVRDGEGAPKFVTVTVKVESLLYQICPFPVQGTPTYHAHNIASRISASALKDRSIRRGRHLGTHLSGSRIRPSSSSP